MDWQPIESAPKDGTRFIAAWPAEDYPEMQVSTDVYHWRDRWISEGDGLIEPTHWMPFPKPPANAARTKDPTHDRLAPSG